MQPKLSASSWRHNALWIMLITPAVSLANIPSDSLQQKTISALNGITEKSLHSVNDQYVKIQKLIVRKTEMLLLRMQRKEHALENQIAKKDSLKAQQCFGAGEANYTILFLKLKSSSPGINPVSYKDYVPALDSMQTAMAFLQSGNPVPALGQGKFFQVELLLRQATQLQGKLQQTNEVQNFVRQREQQLKEQLAFYGMGKQLLSINKQVYYYQQELASYKDMLNDRDKATQAIIGAVKESPLFQHFWQKYSLLAQLFPMPANYGTELYFSAPQQVLGLDLTMFQGKCDRLSHS